MISDEVVEQVRSAADIVEIVSEFVPLRRSGGTWRGPCPFHQGKNPNFSVSPSHGSFHCFVCHESGDVFTFVRKRLGLDWPAAVKYVGEKVGIEVVDVPRRAVEQDPNAPNHEALAAAAEWFQQQLRDETTGRDARRYLTQRGLDAADWERFGLGFAPRDGHAMRRYLHSLGHDDARLVEAGLLALWEGEGEPRGRFRGRVMFPIQDEFGRHVGFGGRAMGDEQPKYLNSPESSVFQKRRTLYGLHTAKQAMRRARRAIVVEGYLDAIRLTLAGLEEVVAPLGTALTEEQSRLLARYAQEIFLLYDSDDAGQKATFRSGMELLRERVAVRVVTLPEGEDPDSFVRAQGRAAMEAHIAMAMDLFDRQVQVLERRGWFGDLRRRRRSVDKLLPTIRAAADPLTRELYLARLSDVTGMDKAALQAEAEAMAAREQRRATSLGQQPRNARSGDGGAGAGAGEGEPVFEGAWPPESHGTETRYGEGPAGVPLPPPASESDMRAPWKGRRGKQGATWKATSIPPRPRTDEPVERALVRAMLHERGVAEMVAERHPPASFRSAPYRELFGTLLHAPLDEDLGEIAQRLSDESVQVLRDLTEGTPFRAEGADLALHLDRLDARSLEDRIAAILETMRLTDDRAEKDVLMRERLELESELRRLLPIRSPRTKPRR